MQAVERPGGAIVSQRDLQFEPEEGCLVSRPVGPATGAELVRVEVARVPGGRCWRPLDCEADEANLVVFSGAGTGVVEGSAGGRPIRDVALLGPASAVHSPTGCSLTVQADAGQELVVYVWRSRLPAGPLAGRSIRTSSSLWNAETRLTGFTGYGELADPDARPATMNFIFWPGTGCARLCLHCGIQEPGETFNVHVHPDSEEAFMAFEGTGQVFLRDRWCRVSAGDLLFVPPGLPHGARNPYVGPGAQRFVTCGGPTPFDPFLYERAGVSPEVR